MMPVVLQDAARLPAAVEIGLAVVVVAAAVFAVAAFFWFLRGADA